VKIQKHRHLINFAYRNLLASFLQVFLSGNMCRHWQPVV